MKQPMHAVATVLAIWFFGHNAPASGHDLAGLVAERSALEPEVAKRFDEMAELRRLLAMRATRSRDQQVEAVVQQTLKWSTSQASVCFFDGRPKARDHVATVAQRWMKSTGLRFDFGPEGNRRTCDPANPSDIRVSFLGGGYWSYVGIQAKHVDANKQTLNLSAMDRETFSPSDDGVILHEFGHAVGFEHEHQSPVSGCEEEFDWGYLYRALGWSKSEVERNMRRLNMPSRRDGLLVTAFDEKSIMLYALEPAAFKNSATAKCYIRHANNDLSTTDVQAAATVYPVAATVAPPRAPESRPAEASTEDIITDESIRQLRSLAEPEGFR